MQLFALLWLFGISAFKLTSAISSSNPLFDGFYMVSKNGHCQKYEYLRNRIISSTAACEMFYWKGPRIFHRYTNRCMTVVDNLYLTLTTYCNGTDTFFQHDENRGIILHFGTNKYVTFPNEAGSPSTVSNNENVDEYRVWLPQQYNFIIRQGGDLCLEFNSLTQKVTLVRRLVCHRYYMEGKKIIHLNSNQHVKIENEKVEMIGDNSINVKIKTSGTRKCLQPSSGMATPTAGTELVASECVGSEAQTFTVYHVHDVFRIEVESETDYVSGAKAKILVNGHDYSTNTRGINVATFDYRSGIFEHKEGYDFYGSSTAQPMLAAYLNSLIGDKIIILAVRGRLASLTSNTDSVLQKFGVPGTFIKDVADAGYRRYSLACVLFTGPIRMGWAKCMSGPTQSSISRVIRNAWGLWGAYECSSELGLSIGFYGDSAFSAKSVFRNDTKSYGPHLAKLHNANGAWCSEANSPISDYLQVDINVVRFISGIAIAGLPATSSDAVTEFSIEFSVTGEQWYTYKNMNGNKQIFQGCNVKPYSTKVNWFPKVLLRWIRIIPTSRISSRHCMRIELFGCEPKRTIMDDILHQDTSRNIFSDVNKHLFILSHQESSSEIKFQFSTAENITTLKKDIPQYKIKNVENSLGYTNGSIEIGNGNVRKTFTDDTNVYHKTEVCQQIKNSGYFNSEIKLKTTVMDTGLPSGNIWNTYSMESRKEILLYSVPEKIVRSANDQSILDLTVKTLNKTGKPNFENGDTLQLDVLLSPHKEESQESQTNAYNVTMVVYYDYMWLSLRSSGKANNLRSNLDPVINVTTPGRLFFSTPKFALINVQNFLFDFQVKTPDKIGKFDRCHGLILIDLQYMTNLEKFNGTSNQTLAKEITYNCQVPSQPKVKPVERLQNSKISVLYDDVNDVLFICKILNDEEINPSCFFSQSSDVKFLKFSVLTTVVGVDTSSKDLYGINSEGRSYFRSMGNYFRFFQVNDQEWNSIKESSNVRKALTAADKSEFPASIQNTHVFSFQGVQKWAVTANGLLRMVDGSWVTVVQL